mmetsp:Transcript_12589/g.20796  ORF Transcript_12589/g.20796 Transcript_12589/m.20796 type:complete len:93 (+) Transcript_12589:521-799(+)
MSFREIKQSRTNTNLIANVTYSVLQLSSFQLIGKWWSGSCGSYQKPALLLCKNIRALRRPHLAIEYLSFKSAANEFNLWYEKTVVGAQEEEL